MKKIFFLFLLLIFFSSVYAQVQVTETNQEGVTAISSIQQDVKLIQIRVNELPTKQEIDTSFIQLDQKISSVNQTSSFSSLAFMIAVMLCNDIIVFGLYIFAKSKGVL